MRANWKAGGGYTTVGMEIVFSVMFGFFGGRWLDARFGTEPYLAVIGFFFGVAAAGRFLWRAHRRMRAEAERDGFEEKNTHRVPRKTKEDEEQPLR